MAEKNYEFKQIASGIIVPALILVIGFGVYFLMLPKYRDIQTGRDHMEQKISEADDRQDQLDDIEALIKNYEEKKDELEKIDKAIPTSPKIPQLLSDLQQLSELSGVLISDLQIELAQAQTTENLSGTNFSSKIIKLQETEAQADQLEMMQITLGLSGSYPALKAFLGNVQQNLRLMDISEIVVESPDEESGDQEFSLKILTYYQKGSK